jgi:hypothetical protein
LYRKSPEGLSLYLFYQEIGSPIFNRKFRQQLYCWLAARFAKQIELPPYRGVLRGKFRREKS